MSRTTRTGPAAGFWEAVDGWAAEAVPPSAVRAWSQSRARLVAESGPYLDVLEVPDDVRLPARPLRSAVAARGVALVDDPEVVAAVEALGLAVRTVDRARRYRWDGPAMTPVVVEVHTAGDEAVLEAWWENVWVAWPTIRLGRESTARPGRRDRATAEVARLLNACGFDPITRPD